MANNLYISEFEQIVRTTVGRVVAAQCPPHAEQKVDFTAGATQSTAFNVRTRFVRLHAEAICSVTFGTNPTASAASMRMTAGQTEYFGVNAGDKLSVITNT